MQLTRAKQQDLYVRVMAHVIACTVNKGRAKPEGTAHRAHEFAEAAVREARISGKRK